MDENRLTVQTQNSSLYEIIDFIEAALIKYMIPQKERLSVIMAAEEIFANIKSYAYPSGSGPVTVDVSIKDKRIFVSFRDSGVPFNPLTHKTPDISLAPEKREIGGLGIFMAKSHMDDITYKNDGVCNILTLIKNIDKPCGLGEIK